MSSLKQIRCNCLGKSPTCKLCNGTGLYQYETGTRGYIPFQCPNCLGAKKFVEGDQNYPCKTCRGEGFIDPADPPPKGMINVLWKILFGA